MTYMKAETVITSREFQQHFARISKQLQPGETIAVTNRGEKIGTFTKSSVRTTVPDFYANIQKLGHSKTAGQKMIEQIVNDLS